MPAGVQMGNAAPAQPQPQSQLPTSGQGGAPEWLAAAKGDPISPEGVQFQPVSSDLAKVRLIGNGLWVAVFLIASIFLGLLVSPYFYIGAGAFVLIFLWLLWLIPRQVKAMGYATTETDFLLRKGILFRQLSVVPYGRIQYVNLSEGPIARHYGISQIALQTASASTDANLDGVPKEEAARLRDLFSRNGTAEMQGI